MINTRFNQRTIESVKERSDIVDVVGEHVVLKRRGKEFIGICPFHEDNKPSMTVSPQKQFYYCFSCGAGGNSIKFLMEFQKRSFSDVILQLAKKYDVPVETLDGTQQEKFRKQLSKREKLYRVLALSAGWFQSQLLSDSGKDAFSYLINQRKLSVGTINNFQIGYAPDSWNSLLNYLSNIENISTDFIEAAGLIKAKKNNDGFYDRFRNRIIVPIFDIQKRIIGFGGRSLDDSLPKYLNSPETELFEKGKHLYGMDKASTHIRKEDYAIVVEGYFDVISLHESGICNSVASLGTALSNNQITNLCRLTNSKRIVLNFDSDTAGIRAASRAITEVEQQAMQGQIELRVFQLPDGKDPDEFLKSNSKSDYEALIDKSLLWLDWQIENVLKNLDLSKSDQFQKAVKGIVELLGKLPHSALRTHYLQKVSEKLSGGHARLALQLEEDLRSQIKGQRWHGRSRKYENPGESSVREKSEADILRLYIHCPSHRGVIRKELRLRDIEDFAFYPHRLVWAAINDFEENIFGNDFLESINRGDNSGNELATNDISKMLIDNFISEDNKTISKINLLLQLDEFNKTSMNQPIPHLIGAAAILERQKSLKRCRHLIDSWSSQRLETLEKCIESLINNEYDFEFNKTYVMEDKINLMFNQLNVDALNFQDLYYSERKHINFLDKQRCSKYQSNL